MRTESLEGCAERQKLYQEYKESGKSVNAYARERGITYWILKERIKRTEREQNGTSGFQEVPLSSSIGGEYVVTVLSGRSLKIPALFNESRVAQLIGILERC